MKRRAFTRIELLAIIAIIAVMICLFLPSLERGGSRKGDVCLSHLRQISLAEVQWRTDHSNSFPWQISSTNGGTLELISSGQAFPHFRALAAYLPNPLTLTCPTDRSRRAADKTSNVENTNVSYFLNLDAGIDDPQHTILAGDRNVEFDGKPASPGLHNVSAARSARWTDEMHLRRGVLAFADGHAEFCRTDQLNEKLREQNVAVSRWVVP